MDKKYVISVPGGLTRTEEILALNRRVQALGKNVTIQTYDTVQGLRWNGGRLVMNRLLEGYQERTGDFVSDMTLDRIDDAVERVHLLNSNGIAFNLTINNVLEEVDVENREGNYLLEHLHDGMNLVTVATRALNNHVRTHYPQFQRVASICFAYSRLAELQRACADYDLVVAMPFIAYQPELIAKLPMEKLSFIVNDGCSLFCRRKDHYELLSRACLNGNSTQEEQARNAEVINGCLFKAKPGYSKRIPDGCELNPLLYQRIGKTARAQATPMDLRNTLPGGAEFNITAATRRNLIRLGINHFKLQGRDRMDEQYQKVVAGFLETFVKDELL